MGNRHSAEKRDERAIRHNLQYQLMEAIKQRDVPKMEKLINELLSSTEKKDKNIFNFRVEGTSPLHRCVKDNYIEGVKILLSHPEAVDTVRASDSSFNSPLHTAIRNNNLEMCQVILDTKHPDLGYATNNKGETIIAAAAHQDNLELFRLIVTEFSKCEVLNWKDADSGFCPLFQALTDNKIEYVKLLLDCPIVNHTMANNRGETTLDYACQKNNVEIITTLLEKGALINVSTATGRTPLHSCLLFYSFDSFLFLLGEEGKKEEVICAARDGDGCCPLHYIRVKEEGQIEKAKACVTAYLKRCPDSIFWKNEQDERVVDKIPDDDVNKPLKQFVEEKMKEGKMKIETDCGFEIQFVSDLHLEFLDEGEFPKIERVCPNLALLGDIGVVQKEEQYRTFLYQMADKFDRVFVIAGNHEFYHLSITEGLSTIQKICDSHENLFFLNNSSYLIEGEGEAKGEEGGKEKEKQKEKEGGKGGKNVRLLGCTLWGDIKEEEMDDARSCANDFRVVRLDSSPDAPKLAPENTKKMHKESVQFLEKEIKKAEENGEEVVILTHHCPVYNLACSHPNEMGPKAELKIHSFNCTDLQHLFRPPLRAWIYGHTHWFQDMEVKGVRVRSNPCGYPQEKHMEVIYDATRRLRI